MGMIRLVRREARLKLGKIRLAVWIVRLARGASVNRPSECSEAEKKESMVEQIRTSWNPLVSWLRDVQAWMQSSQVVN